MTSEEEEKEEEGKAATAVHPEGHDIAMDVFITSITVSYTHLII